MLLGVFDLIRLMLDQYSTKYLDPFHDVAALTRSCLAHQWSLCTKYELSRSPLVQQHYQALANSRSPDMPTLWHTV